MAEEAPRRVIEEEDRSAADEAKRAWADEMYTKGIRRFFEKTDDKPVSQRPQVA